MQAKDEAKKGGHSIIGDKQQAANRTAFKCKTCLQTFAVTTKRAELTQHAETKHKKQVEECFENCPPAAA